MLCWLRLSQGSWLDITLEQKVKDFDKDGKIKKKVDQTLGLLEQFLKEFPFHENPDSIDRLTEEDLFNPKHEYFFKWLEYKLRPLGGYNIGSARVYTKVCENLEKFKEFLHILVDPDVSLADKVDIPTKAIPGLGGNKLIIKKIISVYDPEVIPVFKTTDIEHFLNMIVGRSRIPPDYDEMTQGKKYQLLQAGLKQQKESNSTTKPWNMPYFTRFLYWAYPISRKPVTEEQPAVQMDELRTYGMLYSPVYHDEVVFLFSKLHKKIGFPHIVKIRKEYPDILAIDEKRDPKRIEIETWASQFDHDPKGCDVIVCWENDLVEIPEKWPEIIQLRDYLS